MGTPVAAQIHTTFLQCPWLHVERKVLWVLDTLNCFRCPSISAGSVRGPAEETPECPFPSALSNRSISDPIALVVSSSPLVLLRQ